jgi:hypothetical protein
MLEVAGVVVGHAERHGVAGRARFQLEVQILDVPALVGQRFRAGVIPRVIPQEVAVFLE